MKALKARPTVIARSEQPRVGRGGEGIEDPVMDECWVDEAESFNVGPICRGYQMLALLPRRVDLQ
ncbi:MAG: hypothetical protein CME05_15030 [Gemmatimonadaceae bacterium]|nr:hypothetical protein [Gemmatimonadaceae bacterium]|tara:strand:+ start:427 stop:621 length:195 start_codon:yes stop_codon:yes gene_type:complete